MSEVQETAAPQRATSTTGVPLATVSRNLGMAAYLQWVARQPLPWSAGWDIFVVNLTIEAAVSALSLPFIYLTPDRDWSPDPDDASATGSAD